MQNPPVSPLGNVLFVGAAFPPSVGGSVVVMRELLKHFDSDSYNIVTLRSFGASDDKSLESRTLRVGACRIRPYRLALWLRFLQMPFVLRRACRFARDCGSRVIVCIYPTIDFLFLGCMMAKKSGLPLIVYMHDTLCEAHRSTSFSWVAQRLHNVLRRRVAKTLVMSEGMQSLYLRKYGITSTVLPHVYSEPILPFVPTPAPHQLFWGGAIYGINDKALRRVLMAAKSLNLKMTVTGKSKEAVARQLRESFDSDIIDIKFYPTRAEYLTALSVSGVMVLALNRPDETEFGEGEISTIFPTKTPEYLASGAPILVHCPKHYYLAEFFNRYKCGIVEENINSGSLKVAMKKLLSNDCDVMDMRRRAKEAANYFSPSKVCDIFSKSVSKVLEG